MTQPSSTQPSTIDGLADKYVDDLCAVSPMASVWIGRSSSGSRQLDDLSPDGLAEVYRLTADAHDAIAAAEPTGAADGLAREVIVERLAVERDTFESGWAHADLNVLESPLQDVRMIFDLLPTSTDEDWGVLATKLHAVPEALAGYRSSLWYAAEHGHVPARRQVDKCAEQCATYAGTSSSPGFFSNLVAPRIDGSEGAQTPGDALSRDLKAAAALADAAYRDLGEFLSGTLRARAPEKDAVGRDRYSLASRRFLGDAIDLDETYQWGWEEFLSIERQLRDVSERIAPGQGPAGAAKVLDADPVYQVEGVEALQQWMQRLSDAAVAELGRTHFDIPDRLRTLECRIAPPGGGVGAYYTGPSDDFSRPGRMWWSVEQGREVFSTWRETTTVYHEGVPGHHLQIATATNERDRLNDFQRFLAGTSGHAEGWALYAERLVRELGYLDSDGVLLGMLDSQLFRAARVIVDIGMHLELTIPAGTGFHEGERWTPELGLEFLLTRTITDPAHCRDEIDRYLGWPGQAPAYKIGERVWLEGRAAAQRRHGEGFDLKDFHTRALRMGGMGLGPLARRLKQL